VQVLCLHGALETLNKQRFQAEETVGGLRRRRFHCDWRGSTVGQPQANSDITTTTTTTTTTNILTVAVPGPILSTPHVTTTTAIAPSPVRQRRGVRRRVSEACSSVDAMTQHSGVGPGQRPKLLGAARMSSVPRSRCVAPASQPTPVVLLVLVRVLVLVLLYTQLHALNTHVQRV